VGASNSAFGRYISELAQSPEFRCVQNSRKVSDSGTGQFKLSKFAVGKGAVGSFQGAVNSTRPPLKFQGFITKFNWSTQYRRGLGNTDTNCHSGLIGGALNLPDLELNLTIAPRETLFDSLSALPSWEPRRFSSFFLLPQFGLARPVHVCRRVRSSLFYIVADQPL